MALIKTQGTVYTFDDDLSAAQTLDLISPPTIDSGTANIIDDTRVSSTTKQIVTGIPGGGTASLELQGDLDDAGIVAIIDAYDMSEKRTFVTVYPSGTLKTVTVEAFVTSWSEGGEVDGKLIITAELAFTGNLTIS